MVESRQPGTRSSRNFIALAMGRTINHRRETLWQLGNAERQHWRGRGAAPEPLLTRYGKAKKLFTCSPRPRGLGWESVPGPGCWELETAWLSSHAVNLGIRRVLVIINCNNEHVSLDQISGI